MEPLGTQLYAFGIVLLAGVNLGLFFDLFRVIRGILRPGWLATPLLDLLFWALVTPVIILYLILANWGQLRGYVVVGLILGFSFYRLFLSSLVISILLWLVEVVRRLLNLVVTGIVWVGSLPILAVQEIRFRSVHRVKALAGRGRLPKLRPRLRWRK